MTRFVPLVLATLTAAACEPVRRGAGPADAGSIALAWTFEGRGCAQAGVTVVHVRVDGLVVTDDHDNQDLPCGTSGVDGVVIEPLSPGPHVFDLVGLIGQREAYTLSGYRATAIGGRTVTVEPDLIAASAGSATASIGWTFAGLGCAAALVDEVDVEVDGADAGSVACSSNGVDGALVDGLSSGRHLFRLFAARKQGASKLLVYQSAAAAPADFKVGYTTSLLLDAPAVSPGRGGAALRWKFPAGGPDCTLTSGAGTAITFTLQDPSGAAQAARTATCGGAGGGTALTFCNPAAGGCAPGDTGLAAGGWTITASAPGYAAKLVFGVPNAASASFDVAFAAQ